MLATSKYSSTKIEVETGRDEDGNPIYGLLLHCTRCWGMILSERWSQGTAMRAHDKWHDSLEKK